MLRLIPRAQVLSDAWLDAFQQSGGMSDPRLEVEKDPVDVRLGPLLAMEAAQHAPGRILLGAVGQIAALSGQ